MPVQFTHKPDRAKLLTPFLETEVAALERAPVHRSFFNAVRQEGQELNYTRRIDNLGTLFRDLDTEESVRFLMAASKLALSGDITGLRVLFSFCNVRRSGVEVLKQLHGLSSVERASLQLLSGRWKESEHSDAEHPAYAVTEVLEEAAAQNILESPAGSWPKSPAGVRATLDALRRWLAWMTLKLAAQQKISKPAMDLVTQLCLLEISLAERRVSQLAERVDPYDMRGMARLMPVLSRYDQNIELWKQVIAEIHTYVPFSRVMLTMEALVTDTEIGKIQNGLLKEPGGRSVGLLLQTLRRNPVLDRELLCLVSTVYQTGNLCALNHPRDYEPVDLFSATVGAVEAYHHGTLPPVPLEDEVLETVWPVLETWGLWRSQPEGLVYSYNPNRSMDFIHPDGTPVLDPVPGKHEENDLSLEDLLLTQLNNDAFILGLLDNPKALKRPTLVATVAMMSRSIRVLSKIANTRSLYTGPNNQDVPRLLLGNPARLPVNTLRRFIHVRFVGKRDLEKMSRRNSDVRPEVRQEVERYLGGLKG